MPIEEKMPETEAPIGRSRKSKRKIKTRKQIIIRRIIILSVLEVITLFCIFSYAYVRRALNQIQHPDFAVENVENKDLTEENLTKMKGYWNIAAFGVDSRDNSVGKGNNSDVIMIISINQETGEVRICSVFRDSYMSIGNGSYNKINAAYAVGGPELAVKALNQDLDLNITDYITFNWKAVATGVNILGGVDVELSKAEFYYINSYITETVKVTKIGSTQLEHAGMNHLDGVQAVAYARLREMDTDYARTERQRKVIALSYEKAKKADLATVNSLAGNILSMVATNISWQDVMNVATNVSKYHIGETGGFPFSRGEGDVGRKGGLRHPAPLESNVKDLHKLLFDDDDYQCSETVKNISARIISDTGITKKGTYVDHVGTDNGYIPQSSTKKETAEGTGSETKESKVTGTSVDANGKIYETDESGKVIRIYETDASGNTKTHETDANGNIIDESENDNPAGTKIGPGINMTAAESSPGSTVSGGISGRGLRQRHPVRKALRLGQRLPGLLRLHRKAAVPLLLRRQQPRQRGSLPRP